MITHAYPSKPFDLLIIGGGINGAGIARDAAGRGLSVALVEQDDLASGTSSASTKLIHGGLRYLEFYEFSLVREALAERERLLSIAPHIVWPMRFVLPHHKGLRPPWMLRAGLMLYDTLASRRALQGTVSLDLREQPHENVLLSEYRYGFEYSDCWVEDSRLVVLNAMDARDHGAVIATRTKVTHARHEDGAWCVEIEDQRSGQQNTISAKALVNAGGPFVDQLLKNALRETREKKTIRLVRGSHIITRKLFEHDRAYIFQQSDGRIVFAIPYEHDFTLIGTTEVDVSDPRDVEASHDEVNYLCEAASGYFKTPVTPDDVVATYGGIRPLYDEGGKDARSASRDYVLKLDTTHGGPLLNIFGGKLTTYRRLAEEALEKLKPFFPTMSGQWTASRALPGGDFDWQAFDKYVEKLRGDYAFLAPQLARRLARAYGTKAREILGNAKSMKDLGADYGAGLTACEVSYLMRHEFAETCEDILKRRSKLYLHMTDSEKDCLSEVFE
jgi:glycerol-3-phosphate dehydrogenase